MRNSDQRSYPSVGRWRSPASQDAWLVFALGALLLMRPPDPLAVVLWMAIPAAVVWSLVTLHFPSRVDVGAESISFSAYGRAHTFAWSQVRSIRVRRFLVRDRVLVRIEPGGPWRGRYWLMDSLQGFDALVRELEDRGGKERREPAPPHAA